MSKLSKKEHWGQVVKNWISSGQQVAIFCKENKITIASFYQWRNRLMPDYPKRSKAHSKEERTNKLFVPIEINTRKNKMSPLIDETLTLHYPNGCYLRLSKHFDAEVLKRFNKAMGV